MYSRWTMLTAAGFLLLSSVTSAADKYALLVGVTEYKHGRMNDTLLKYPEADATAVADMLQASGYTVKTLLGKNATQHAITDALEKVAGEGTSEGVVFVGMFGHGVQYGDDAFYGPYDTSIRIVKDSNNRTVRDKNRQAKLEPDPGSMISMQSILDSLTVCGARNRVLIADCCREDPSAARGRAFGSKLRLADLPPGTAALFACSANERAFEHDDWKHGAFTKALLDESQRLSGGGKVRANALAGPVYDRVQSLVSSKTNGRSRQTVNLLINGIVDLQLKVSKAQQRMTTPLKPITEPPTPRGDEPIANSLGMKLQLIPAGEFMMGSGKSAAEIAKLFDSDADYYKAEHPQHRVRITEPFYLQTTEVTQGQWRSVMGTEPWKGRDYVKEGSDYAASYVSHEDAVAFCRRLSAREGVKYRLPTEAAWEYACRGGGQTSYSFGSSEGQLGPYAWFEENAWDLDEKYAHVVGQKLANGFGLYDMHGNVWEWCSDWYGEDYYGESPGNDPKGPSGGSARVNRGGSWLLSPQSCRSAYRSRLTPSYRGSGLGFRVLRSSVK
jgi:formylglycine-generating enzyme required for sulfatase activity